MEKLKIIYNLQENYSISSKKFKHWTIFNKVDTNLENFFKVIEFKIIR